MEKSVLRSWAMGIAGLLACAGVTQAYPVGPSMSLEKLVEEADVVFKGIARGGQAVEDTWFRPYHGFYVRQTRFDVVSVIKGERPGDRLAFRHYDTEADRFTFSFTPQTYQFEAGSTYLIFAKRGGAAGVYRQLWLNHKAKEDQGVLLCRDARPVTARTVKEAMWAELTGALASPKADDVIYAIRQLDQMSGGPGRYGGLSDFDRRRVLGTVKGAIGSEDPKVAQAALALVGSHNPYTSEAEAPFWLGTVGSAGMPGLSKRDPAMRNLGGELYWQELVALANSKAVDETRAMAIRALGLVRNPLLWKPVQRWLTDPAPAVRAAATLLLVDFGTPVAGERMAAMATDKASEVRVCVAYALGFGQKTEQVGVLAGLLADAERKARQAAAMSLLSFLPTDKRVAEVFRANLGNREFHPLFLIALAQQDPGEHLDALAEAVLEKAEPRDFWGGRIPAFRAWEILFGHLRKQPVEAIRSGKFDRHLDAMESVGNYSSSEPRDVYAFYVQRGMTERAKAFRQKAKATLSYDIDHYFRMVDKNPSGFKRQ